ncbi:E3 ubiquitin-protein ligase ATL9-like [Juglans regia]|uniref:E3 ubiquitin-protein ligase ATL9-like n=1 Tax=Juglans regia TaxID=51240 RepID=A0A2I4DM70_JUGRE|nr:E3 ubiquitin-protein ligase ATL9-like [Juglans regia]
MPAHYQPSPPTPTPTPTPSKPNPKLLSLLLKAIIMTLLTSLFFLFLDLASATLLLLHISLSSHRHRHRRSSLPSTSSSGLPPRDLNTLPHFRLKRHARKNGAAEDEECVVCLDSFRDGQCCRKLAACGHLFHKRCVDSWLVKVASCPMCRARVQSNAGTKGSMVGLEEDEDKKLWGDLDQLLISVLNSSLTDTVLAQVLECATSSKIWSTLHNLYDALSYAHIIQTQFQLATLKKGPKSITKYFHKAKNLSTTLSAAGQPLSPSQFSAFLLAGLGTENESVSSLTIGPMPLDSRGDIKAVTTAASEEESSSGQHAAGVRAIEGISSKAKKALE